MEINKYVGPHIKSDCGYVVQISEGALHLWKTLQRLGDTKGLTFYADGECNTDDFHIVYVDAHSGAVQIDEHFKTEIAEELSFQMISPTQFINPENGRVYQIECLETIVVGYVDFESPVEEEETTDE
jgi:hypothetical protein